MRLGGFKQVQPVAFGLGKGLFVAKDHLVGVVVQLAQGDESAPLFHHIRPRHLESLRVGEDAGRFLLNQNALFAPGAEVARRPGVDTFVSLGIEEFRQTKDDPDQVEGTALVISLLHGRRDFVIRLGNHIV